MCVRSGQKAEALDKGVEAVPPAKSVQSGEFSKVVPFGSKKPGFFGVENGVKPSGIRYLMMTDVSAEKAGVGGSIPSLATMFSTSYSHPKPSVCSILFQFQNQACRNLPQTRWLWNFAPHAVREARVAPPSPVVTAGSTGEQNQKCILRK